MNQFLEIFKTILPVFIIVISGIFFKKIKLINDDFISQSSRFVFNAALPALVFLKLSQAHFSTTINFAQIGYAYAATFLMIAISWLLSFVFIKEGRNRGVYIQGSFRSNYAIVGFAIIMNLFGSEALAAPAILLAFIMPLYNVVSVIVLTVTVREGEPLRLGNTVLEVIKNPLIIAVVISIPVSLIGIEPGFIITTSADYLARVALPLALIGIGGSLNYTELKSVKYSAVISSVLKLVFFPALFTYIAYLVGFTGMDLVHLFILFSCPTAIASFIMADAIGGNRKLAGNIILITTLGSLLTISAGLYVLKFYGIF